eukprot:555807-Prymnesium_polylepis.1
MAFFLLAGLRPAPRWGYRPRPPKNSPKSCTYIHLITVTVAGADSVEASRLPSRRPCARWITCPPLYSVEAIEA